MAATIASAWPPFRPAVRSCTMVERAPWPRATALAGLVIRAATSRGRNAGGFRPARGSRRTSSYVHMVRTFGGPPPEVDSAHAKLCNPQADRAMTAQLRFASGHTGRVRCAMWSSDLLQLSAEVV